jgi:hypothetical protein
VWFVLYLLSNGVLREMRGILVMVPYTWPIFALAVQERLLSSRNSAVAS